MLIDVFLVVGNQGLSWLVGQLVLTHILSFVSSSASLSPSPSPLLVCGILVCLDCIYLADGLSDGVNLAGLTTSGYAYTDVDIGEFIKADDEKGLVDLEAQDCGLD